MQLEARGRKRQRENTASLNSRRVHCRVRMLRRHQEPEAGASRSPQKPAGRIEGLKTIPTSTHADAPQGAPFIIDRCPFRYGEQIDIGILELDDDKILNWPMVHILSNKESAYIGQTATKGQTQCHRSASMLLNGDIKPDPLSPLLCHPYTFPSRDNHVVF